MGLQLQVKTFKPAAASTTSVAAAQTLGGAGNLTLASAASTGAYAGTNVGSTISLTSTGNISARTFTVTGTDASGSTITEDITGPNNNTVTGSVFFSTVTQIAVDGAVGTNTSAGNGADTVGAIFTGATRVKGAQITTGGTVADISFKESSQTGTTKFFYTVATTTKDYIEPYIPDEGILFREGAFIDLPSGSVVSATVYYG